jgi:hypothetical protein
MERRNNHNNYVNGLLDEDLKLEIGDIPERPSMAELKAKYTEEDQPIRYINIVVDNDDKCVYMGGVKLAICTYNIPRDPKEGMNFMLKYLACDEIMVQLANLSVGCNDRFTPLDCPKGKFVLNYDFRGIPYSLMKRFYLMMSSKTIENERNGVSCDLSSLTYDAPWCVDLMRTTPIILPEAQIDHSEPERVYCANPVSVIDNYVSHFQPLSVLEVDKKDIGTYLDEQKLMSYMASKGKSRIQDMISIVSNIVSDKILFVGDGPGVGAVAAKALSRDCISTDSSVMCCKMARKAGITTFHRGAQQAIIDHCIDSKTCDVVVISHLCHFIPTIVDFCIHRKVKCVVFEPFYFRGFSRLQRQSSEHYIFSTPEVWSGGPLRINQKTDLRHYVTFTHTLRTTPRVDIVNQKAINILKVLSHQGIQVSARGPLSFDPHLFEEIAVFFSHKYEPDITDTLSLTYGIDNGINYSGNVIDIRTGESHLHLDSTHMSFVPGVAPLFAIPDNGYNRQRRPQLLAGKKYIFPPSYDHPYARPIVRNNRCIGKWVTFNKGYIGNFRNFGEEVNFTVKKPDK